jgi:hypothetical protein
MASRRPTRLRIDMRKPLFRYAYERTQAGRLWTAFRHSDDDKETARNSLETQNVPCPAEDPFIGPGIE